jgi:uncharacterized membrane protein
MAHAEAKQSGQGATALLDGPVRAAPARTATERSVIPRLGGWTRKAVLAVHIVSTGAWIGIDLVLAVLVFTAYGTDDPATKALCLQALQLFAIWPMFIAAMIALVSGVLLGLGSKYGLLRYWWVAVKLAINLLISVLILVALRPVVNQAADQARELAAGGPDRIGLGDLIFPPIVAPTLLLTAVILSIFKPWGRIRKR